MNMIPANDLKIGGVSAIENSLKDASEAVITVRGEQRYVVMSLEDYQYFRELELDQAIANAQKDYEEGKYHKGNIKAHIKRISE